MSAIPALSFAPRPQVQHVDIPGNGAQILHPEQVVLRFTHGQTIDVGALSYPRQTSGFTVMCTTVLTIAWPDAAWWPTRGGIFKHLFDIPGSDNKFINGHSYALRYECAAHKNQFECLVEVFPAARRLHFADRRVAMTVLPLRHHSRRLEFSWAISFT